MRFLVRRVGFYVVTAWAAVTINFFIPRMIPGDPVQALINRYQGQLDTDAIASLYVLFGLDKHVSLWDQYWQYWGQLFRGDLGTSFSYFPTPVSEVLRSSLPWTVGLVGVATVIAVVAGSLIGVFLGWRRGTKADAIVPITTFFSSVPYFWLGIIAISAFAVTWKVLPTGGGYDGNLMPAWNWPYVGSVLQHALLPALTIILSSIAGWILGMRNMMVTTTSEDYVTVAQAKGLSERRVMFGYAARNSVLPQISGFALSLGFIVSGTLVMEMVFSYPGIGFRLFQAIGGKDYPLMQGIFLVITLSVLVANALADVVYVMLDPRTRQEA
jgi:peptide/nickel transport system permease protein